MTKYYAMLDTAKIVPLGECESHQQAWDRSPSTTNWLFSEEDLRAYIEAAQTVLRES